MLEGLIIALISGAAGAFAQHWLTNRREVAGLRVEATWKHAPQGSEAEASSESVSTYLLITIENVGKRPILLNRISLAVAGDRVYPIRTEELGSSSDLLDEDMQVTWPYRIEAEQQVTLLANVERIVREIQERRGAWKPEVAVRISDRRTPGFFESRWISFSTGDRLLSA